MSQKENDSTISRFLLFMQNVGVSAFVSALVSVGLASYFQIRLENSKDHVAAIMKGKEEFDASQVNILGKIGLFTKAILLDKNLSDRDELYLAIVASQIQIARLKNEIKSESGSSLDQYSAELEKLRIEVSNVKSKNDLGSLYETTQKILALHDKVTEEVRAKSQISIF